MQNLTRTFVLLSTILIIGCAGLSGKSFDSAMGEWSWKFESVGGREHSGNMTIVDETKATYTYRNGRFIFYATDDQGKWEGHWVEDSGLSACSDKKDGSYYWGVVILQFDDAYTSFSGKYDECGEGHRYDWDGHRR
jgi:hypothetical protein